MDPWGLILACVQERIGLSSTLYCYDSMTKETVSYPLTENACRKKRCSDGNRYGEDRLLPPGYYDLLPRGTGGRIFDKGDPHYTTPGLPDGVIVDPSGTLRRSIGPHVGSFSDGCPLFAKTKSGIADRNDFYRRFRNNVNNGGTGVWVQEK